MSSTVDVIPEEIELKEIVLPENDWLWIVFHKENFYPEYLTKYVKELFIQTIGNMKIVVGNFIDKDALIFITYGNCGEKSSKN